MTKWVRFFLIANVVIYFSQITMGGGFTDTFAFRPALALYRPWTIITYMFLHDPNGFSHILFNMIGLYFFGSRVEDRLGSNRFVTLYFLSGITGALLSFAFAFRSGVIGASGAIYGIMLAYAYFWPRDRIMIWGIIPVEARVLVIAYAIMSVMGGAGGVSGRGDSTAHFAHLGGLVGAFIYLRWIESTTGARRFRAAVVPKIPEEALTNWKKVDPKTVHEVNRDELNRVLDKVSRDGLASLTAEEKRFLMSFVPPDDRPPMVS
jgi:membrane associated rhomboid family serine protease